MLVGGRCPLRAGTSSRESLQSGSRRGREGLDTDNFGDIHQGSRRGKKQRCPLTASRENESGEIPRDSGLKEKDNVSIPNCYFRYEHL